MKSFISSIRLSFLTFWTTFGRGVLFPALTSLAYLFLYPFPAKWVYEFTREQQKKILAIRRRIEEETPLTIEDSRRIRAELAKERDTYYSDLVKKERRSSTSCG